jgi:hypothetical protein
MQESDERYHRSTMITLEEFDELYASTPRSADGCRYWTGVVNHGYGIVRIWPRRQALRANRVSLERKLGRPICTGMMALHDCDHPLCIEHQHLYEGTAQDNADDKVHRGRVRYILPDSRGERNGGAVLTASAVREIRKLYSDDPKITLMQLSEMFGVSGCSIHNVISRKTWSHVE